MKKVFRKTGVTIVVATLLFSLLPPSPISAQSLTDVSSLRCATELIVIGDPSFRVEEACGKPDYVRPAPGGSVWIYNLGPTEFVYYLSFDRGELRRLQAGGYGWDENGG